MKIAITGTRGIPNQYGGFEQFAEYLSDGLSELGHQVWVYNPHFHSYDKGRYKGVEIVQKRFPEKLLGSAGNYLYDLACMKDAIKRKADIILECGYASAAPWYPFLRFGKTRLITHMDGMERQREKWGVFVRKLFLRAEKMAVRYSDALVCDHPEIAKYYLKRYANEATMIAYGADNDLGTDAENKWNPGVPEQFELKSGEYYLLVARLEPENKIRMIIEGFLASETDEVSESLVIVGNHDRGYGSKIFREFGRDQRLRFPGGLFDQNKLNNLRHFSKAEFHGHSVGGINPSLLEAMAAGASIFAHDNVYNRWVLGNNASYFRSANDIKKLVLIENDPEDTGTIEFDKKVKIANNLDRIKEEFQWSYIVRQYENLFRRLSGK